MNAVQVFFNFKKPGIWNRLEINQQAVQFR